MRINTQCSIALHCLILIAEYQNTTKVTSELLAQSTGCHAAAIRSILNALQKAGIIRVVRGVGGAYLNRQPSELTIWDVYHALEPDGLEHSIGVHPHPSEKCPVGRNIRSVLRGAYQQISDSVQVSMSGITLVRLLEDYRDRLELVQPETNMTRKNLLNRGCLKMKDIQLLNAYFSPTGTTYQVASAIAEGTGCQVAEMDLSDPGCGAELCENTVLLVSAPVYGGRIPAVAVERLSRLKGTGQKAVAVAVYGNREFDDALLELKNTLVHNGFQVVAAAAFIAEHSIVRSIAAGRPDEKDRAIARKFGADVMEKLDVLTEVDVPGNDPYVAVKPSAFHPQANETCVQCGLCAQKCPVAAIPAEDPGKTLDESCINCMRCVKVCPVQARALPAPFLAGATKMLEEKAAGYKLPQLFGV